MLDASVRLDDHVRLPRAWDTLAASLTSCAAALGDTRTVAEIAAGSALAFRVAADDQVTLGGPHAWPWPGELAAAAARLGYRAEVVSSSEAPGTTLHDTARAAAMALVRAGLPAGRPTLVWGVHAPEFGIVRGLDGDMLEVSGILDGVAPALLPTEQLGCGAVPVVLAAQLTGRIPSDEKQAVLSTMRAALTLGRGPAPTLAGVYVGLEAWRIMARALSTGVIDPSGLAYAAQRYAEARSAIVAWLDRAERVLDADLEPARTAYRRAASMLAELAACHPFPPAHGAMLTSSARDQAQGLVEETACAEARGLDGLAAALAGQARRRTQALTVVDVDESRLGALFRCLRDLPVAGLAGEAERCRDRIAPGLGADFRGQLLYEGPAVVGQLLYAPLEASRYPLAAEGRRWFVFCPWIASHLRGRGFGTRLFGALIDAARTQRVDGLLTFATDDEQFLHVAAYARFGFREVDRRGELHLLELRLSDAPSRARLLDLPTRTAPRPGALPVVVRHAYNCPLLLRTRLELARLARELGSNVGLDEADAGAEPSGATLGGRALPHGPIPKPVLAAALAEEAGRW